MQRLALATLALCLLASVFGCSRPKQADAPVKTSPSPSAAPADAPAPPADGPAPPPPPVAPAAEPVDWPAADDGGKLPAVPVHAGACTPGTATGKANLQVQVTAADWRVHPLSKGQFWVPAVVITVCNAGTQPLDYPYLQLATGGGKADLAGSRSLPKLQPGAGLGPIRLFAAAGVPARVGALWVEDGRRWPDWTLQVREQGTVLAEAPVRRLLGGRSAAPLEAPGGAAGLPDLPALQLLQRLAWSQGETSPDGKRRVAIFLYAPDATYTIAESSYCGAVAGQVGVDGKRWAFYTSVDGSPPVRAAEIGQTGFEGGRGMSVEAVPALNTTFLFLGRYGTCANPSLHDIYAYDHASGEVFHPRMLFEDGTEGAPSVGGYEFTGDGKLVSKSYNNGGGPDGGWHTRTYRWDAQQRIWRFESDVRRT